MLIVQFQMALRPICFFLFVFYSLTTTTVYLTNTHTHRKRLGFRNSVSHCCPSGGAGESVRWNTTVTLSFHRERVQNTDVVTGHCRSVCVFTTALLWGSDHISTEDHAEIWRAQRLPHRWTMITNYHKIIINNHKSLWTRHTVKW